MPFPLSGFPNGLLSLVGSQSFGTAPKLLGDVVAPIVDTGELYLLSAQEPEVLIIGVPVGGINPGIRVPPGEVWRIVVGGILVITGVGVTLNATLIVESQGGLIPIGDTRAYVASDTNLQAMRAAPFWAKAGDHITAYVQNLVGVPTISIALLIQRLRA